MDITAGLAGLKAAADLTRILRDAAKAGTMKPDEFAGRVGEIYDYIVDSKDALVQAKDKIQELKAKLETISDRQEISNQLAHDGYVYWRKPPEGTTSGPYCVFCWEKEDRLVPLTHIPGTYGAHASKQYRCFSHGSVLIPTREPREDGGLNRSGPRGPYGWMAR